jgi:prepilin-type N-terminal cleavage/methylation domain-containing protein
MRKPHRTAAGFTLIELMVVVAIVGILSSVAIPSFQKFALRTKTSERANIMLRIRQAICDYYVRNGQVQTVVGAFNPPFGTATGPGSVKRKMLDNQAGWNVYFTGANNGAIGSEIEGSLYYSYTFSTTEGGGASAINIWAYGDLDGDGVSSIKWMNWTRQSGIYVLQNEVPAAGLEDDASPPYTF